MKEVKFEKQWRGHDPGTIVELTDERAAQLISEGYCESTAKPEKKKRGRPSKTRPEAEPVLPADNTESTAP